VEGEYSFEDEDEENEENEENEDYDVDGCEAHEPGWNVPPAQVHPKPHTLVM
jgi:hypothetical protein